MGARARRDRARELEIRRSAGLDRSPARAAPIPDNPLIVYILLASSLGICCGLVSMLQEGNESENKKRRMEESYGSGDWETRKP